MNTSSSPLLSRLSITFVILAIIIALVSAYVLIGSATIKVYPTTKTIKNKIDVIVGNTGGSDLPQILDGEIWNDTISMTKTFTVEKEYQEIEGKASGEIVIFNNNSKPQTLVATTRFLTPDNILYRLEKRVVIPPKSSITSIITADKPGASGNITGPITLSIPGLNPAMQQRVYGKLEGSLSGGIKRRGKLTQEDIDRGVSIIKDAIAYEARVKRLSDSLEKNGIPEQASLPESLTKTKILSKDISASVGELVDNFTVSVTAQVTGVSYDRNDLVRIAQARIISLLPDGEELVSLDPGSLEVSLDSIDQETQTANLSIVASGKSIITPESQIVPKHEIVGLTSDELREYFESIPGIDKITVEFNPFWVTRVPRLTGQINMEIQ